MCKHDNLNYNSGWHFQVKEGREVKSFKDLTPHFRGIKNKWKSKQRELKK